MKEYTLLDVFTPEGFYVTQGYGLNPATYSKYGLLWHEGLDLGDRNDPSPKVRAAHDGIVVRDVDTPKDNYGDYIVIWDDKQQCATWYCHLKENYVSVGQRVKAGDLIGIMGSTGNVTGKHLHFNFVLTDANGNRLHKYKTRNLGFLDPQFPDDPNPPKYPPSVPEYKVNWVEKIIEDMPEDTLPVKKETYEMLVDKATKFDKLNSGELITKAKHEEEKRAAVKEYKESLYKIARQLGLPATDTSSDILGKIVSDQDIAKKDLEFRESVINKLNVSDRAQALGEITGLIEQEDNFTEEKKKYENKIIQLEKEAALEIDAIKEAVKMIKGVDVEKIFSKLDTIERRITNVEDKKEEAKEQSLPQESTQNSTRFSQFVEKVLNFFRGLL